MWAVIHGINKRKGVGSLDSHSCCDANNRLTNRWSAAKGNTGYAYDPVGNLTNINYPTSPDVTFQYDCLNRLTNMVDAAGTTKYTYTAGNQLLTEDGPFTSDTVTNTYQNRLRVALSLQQPTGAWTNGFAYDAARRLTNVTSQAGAFTNVYSTGVDGSSGFSSGLIQRQLLANHSAITNNYDSVARLLATHLRTSTGVLTNKHEYLYNLAGQRTNETRMDSSTVAYRYDNIGQLKVADSSVAAEDRGYAYDMAWNLNYRTNNGLTTTYSVDSRNRLTSVGSTPDSYDVNGNLVQVGSSNGSYVTYLYDDENRLTEVATNYSTGQQGPVGGAPAVQTSPMWKSDFVYDGLGRLRERFDYAGGTLQTTVLYVYDGWRVIQERNQSSTPTVSYTRGNDLSGSLEGAGGIGGLLARSSGYSSGNWSTNNVYHADGNGNITFMLNSSQTMVASYRYDPFGNTISSSGSLATANTYRFSSKEIHVSSGMYYYGYRFYDPYLQRWINRDPMGEEGGVNLYQAMGNSSVLWVDPFGLTLKIDPSSSDTFQSQIKGCLCYLINHSPMGLQLVNEAISNPHTITVAPDDDGAGTIGSVLDPPWGAPNPTIGVYPTTPNGMDPTDYADAKRCHEAPPNNVKGCALMLAHELGHALYNYGEPEAVVFSENPVRRDFRLPPRVTYHCKPVYGYLK